MAAGTYKSLLIWKNSKTFCKYRSKIQGTLNNSRISSIEIINLKELEHKHEFWNGSLYTMLQIKLPEPMLAFYYRWIFEYSISGSVLTLRTCVTEES